MAGGDVQPVNVELLQNYDNVFEGLKNQPHNSLDGVPYGVPHGRGPNLLMWNTEEVEDQTTWNGLWEDAANYAGQAEHLRLARLHRRCLAALDGDAARHWASPTRTS